MLDDRIRRAQSLTDAIRTVYIDRWETLAIPHRNWLLDEYLRAQQTIEAIAEAKKETQGE